MQLRKEVPLELVVNMFRKLVSLFFSLLLPNCIVSPTYITFLCVIESAAHHVLAGRRTDGHDHKNGRRRSVNGALCPSWRARRGETRTIVDNIFITIPPKKKPMFFMPQRVHYVRATCIIRVFF